MCISFFCCCFLSSMQWHSVLGEARGGICCSPLCDRADKPSSLRCLPDAQLAAPRWHAVQVHQKRVQCWKGRWQEPHQCQRRPEQPLRERDHLSAEGQRHGPLPLWFCRGKPFLWRPETAWTDWILPPCYWWWVVVSFFNFMPHTFHLFAIQRWLNFPKLPPTLPQNKKFRSSTHTSTHRGLTFVRCVWCCGLLSTSAPVKHHCVMRHTVTGL